MAQQPKEHPDLRDLDAPASGTDHGRGVNYLPVRRRPELMRFLWVGGILGFVLGGLVGLLGPATMNSSALQDTILLGGIGLLLGGFLGAVVYLVADWRSMRG